MTPPASAGVRQGYNLFKIWFAEAPQSAVTTDYGEWRTTCGWARYDPPIRIPVEPDLVFSDSDFISSDQFEYDSDYLSRCLGNPP